MGMLKRHWFAGNLWVSPGSCHLGPLGSCGLVGLLWPLAYWSLLNGLLGGIFKAPWAKMVGLQDRVSQTAIYPQRNTIQYSMVGLKEYKGSLTFFQTYH